MAEVQLFGDYLNLHGHSIAARGGQESRGWRGRGWHERKRREEKREEKK